MRIDGIIKTIDKRTWIVFFFFTVIIFFLFRDLFNSYFEADEWFHYTYYLPLTQKPDGFLTAIVSTFINSGPLSAGQHVVPVASAIYFLNTKFFGLNYAPYAFMSLLLHAVNSFLVFYFIKTLLFKREVVTRNIFAILSGLFFALSPQSLHTITGAAPFYGQNILSVTFFLLCILSFKLIFIQKNKKFIYPSILFLFLSLFTKETAVFLFALLPIMVLIEKKTDRKIFTSKFWVRLFAVVLITYAIFRFIVPNIYNGVGPIVDKLVGSYISSTLPSWQQAVQDSQPKAGPPRVEIHKNLPAEIVFRTFTFPVRMTGTLFLPRETLNSIVKFITPIIYPAPSGDPGARATGQLQFTVGAGNDAVLYLFSISILILIVSLLSRYLREKLIGEFQAVLLGFSIIVLSAIPLVAIIFSFPSWGYDTYFDSRFNYNPNIGAAFVFPFLIFGIANFFSKVFRKEKLSLRLAILVFVVWFLNNMFVLNLVTKQFISKYSEDRREFVNQLKNFQPTLSQKIVFYTETDGLSAYGPNLPFNTGVAQALTVVYYDKNHLPDSFYNKPILGGKNEGYFFSEGRGFGYFSSKKNLAQALRRGEFQTSDVRAFYFKAKEVKLIDITKKIRLEMEEYLLNSKINQIWEKYQNEQTTLTFWYPNYSIVEKQENFQESYKFINLGTEVLISIFPVSESFNLNEYLTISQKVAMGEKIRLSFDKFHYNDVYVENREQAIRYLIKINDKLIIVETQKVRNEIDFIVEKIVGSIEVN